MFISLGLGIGSYFILDNNNKNNLSSCGGLKEALYAVMSMHAVNTMLSLINLCGCETWCCSSNLVCGFAIFEIGMLVFMQITYFTAQNYYCLSSSPDLYFWMMAQILVLYAGIAVILCYFFRRFCQDDEDDFQQQQAAEGLTDKGNKKKKKSKTGE